MPGEGSGCPPKGSGIGGSTRFDGLPRRRKNQSADLAARFGLRSEIVRRKIQPVCDLRATAIAINNR
jgi:hypothetical protein